MIKLLYFSILFGLLLSVNVKAQDFPEIDINLVNKYRSEGQLYKAEQYLEKYISDHKKYENSIRFVIPYIVIGRVNTELEEYEDAIYYFKRALKIMDKNSGWLYPDYAMTLNWLITVYYKTEKFDQAIAYIKEVRDIEEQTIGERHILNIYTVYNRALLASKRGDYVKSDSLFQATIRKAKVNYTPEIYYRDFAEIEIFRVENLQKQGEFKEALESLLILKHKLLKYNLIETALSAKLNITLGDVYTSMDNYDQAILYYNIAKKTATNVYGNDRIAYANVLFRMVNLYLKKLDLDEAEKLSKEGISIYESHKVINKMYHFGLISLANCYHIRGEFKKSGELFQKVQLIINDQSEYYPFYLSSLTRYYFAQNQYIETELVLSELKNIIKDNYQLYIDEYRFANLISIEFNIIFGRYGRCEQSINEAQKFIDQNKNRNKLFEIYFTYTEAVYQYAIGNYESSLNTLYELDTIVIRKFGKNYLRRIQIKYMIAKNLSAMDDHKACIDMIRSCDRLIKLYKITENELYVLRIYSILGEEYKQEGVNDKAMHYYNKILNVAPKISLIYTSTLGSIAYMEAMNGEWEKAEQHIIEASLSRVDFYEKTLNYSNEDEKRLYLNNTSDVFDIFDALMYMRGDSSSQKIIEHCYNLNVIYRDYFTSESEQAKLNVIALEEHRTRNGFPRNIDKLFNLRDKVATLSYMSEADREALGVNPFEIVDRAKNLEKVILFAANSFQMEENENSQTWKDVQVKLGPEDIAIDILKLYNYDHTDANYYAIMLDDKCDSPLFIKIGNAKHLETEMFEKYTSSLHGTRRGGLFIQQQSDPYDAYWLPIKEGIQQLENKAYRIYICPFGVYNFINVNTLKNPKTKEYVLLEDYVFYVSSTMKDVNNQSISSAPKKKTAMLVGNPVFHKKLPNEPEISKEINSKVVRGYDKEGGLVLDLEELPGTEQEITNVKTELESQGWEVNVLLQEDASESNVTKLVKSPTVLHIATHGFYINKLQKEITANRMVRAGLFLSEVAEYGQGKYEERYNAGKDGILTAYEALSLDLKDTELVVLSACQVEELTDIGEEGVSAIQQSFKVAGAKSLLMSLWSVDDDATALLMTSFYEKWVCCKDKYQAFREAQYERMKDPVYSSPYYWGAFVMIN